MVFSYPNMDCSPAPDSSVAPGCPRIPRAGLRTLGAILLTAACATPSNGWIRTELFLGRALPDGGTLTPAEVDAFLTREAGPRLPGWTVLEARGHWTAPDGGAVNDPTSVLVFVHPAGASEVGLEEVRRAYAREHGQQSVLRVDTPAGASF